MKDNHFSRNKLFFFSLTISFMKYINYINHYISNKKISIQYDFFGIKKWFWEIMGMVLWELSDVKELASSAKKN